MQGFSEQECVLWSSCDRLLRSFRLDSAVVIFVHRGTSRDEAARDADLKGSLWNIWTVVKDAGSALMLEARSPM